MPSAKMSFSALDLDSDSESECLTPPRSASPANPLSDSSSAPLPSYLDNWALWTDIDDAPPCRCCSPVFALDQEEFWTCCRSGRQWLLLETPFSRNSPHPEGVCPGRCRFHPLVSEDSARWIRGVTAGLTWGDLWSEEDAVKEAQMSPEEKAERERFFREQEEKDAIAREAAARARKADRVAIRTGVYCHREVQKIQQPCKFLYNCQGTPARPTTKRVTTECWSHEYTDPATGKIVRKHACDRLHPGEVGWCPQWDGNPSYKPSAGTAPLAKTAPARPAAQNQSQNRFAAFVEQAQQPKRKY